MYNLNHRHMVGKVIVSNPPHTAEEGTAWLRELVDKIDMKVLIEPKSVVCNTFGNEGVTGIVCLETSHASFHSWSEIDEPFINFDVYSCAHFEAETIIKHFERFSPIAFNYVIIDRNKELKIIESR